jgi:hypothetical protein
MGSVAQESSDIPVFRVPTIEEIREARKKRLTIAMLSVYGDESSDETGETVFAVAGLIGPREEWDALKPIWYKRTGGKIFHAADCETGYHDYAGIDLESRLQEYKDLTQIICASQLWGYGVAIDISAYRTCIQHITERYEPYFYCFIRAITYFACIATHQKTLGKANFIFDRNCKTRFSSVILVEYLANMKVYQESSFIGSITFSSIDDIEIQVADLLARETMKHLYNIIGPKQIPIRKSILSLKNTNRFEFDFLDSNYFELKFKPMIKSIETNSGRNRQDYLDWLCKNKLDDNLNTIIRYLIYLDSLKIKD